MLVSFNRSDHWMLAAEEGFQVFAEKSVFCTRWGDQ
jgi:hypothetical protein